MADGYREWGSTLPGAVVWARDERAATGPASNGPSNGPGNGPGYTRVLPDGCLDLIRGPGGLVVAGPDRVAHLAPATPGALWVGLRLPPGVGPAVLGVPACELRDRRVRLADLWGDAAAARLERRLAGAEAGGAGEAGEAAEAGAVLGDLARARLERTADGDRRGQVRLDPAMLRLVALLRRGAPVGRAADALSIGARQLHRRSLVAFGYGPKTLARILRLATALELARSGLPPARAAADAGYADQPHLSREVRALAGVPLGQLLGRASAGGGAGSGA